MKKSMPKAIVSVALAVVMVMLAVVPALASDPMVPAEERCKELVWSYLGREFSEITVNFIPNELGAEDWYILRAEDPNVSYPSALDEFSIGKYFYTAPCLYGTGKISRLATYAVDFKNEIVYPLETALRLGYINGDALYEKASWSRLRETKDLQLAFWMSLLGDADENEVVNVVDATIIQKMCAGFQYRTDSALDMNGDGKLDVTDATQVQKLSAGFELPLSGDEVTLRGNQAMMDFAVRLLQASDTDGKNVLISPLSVMYALAMTANGAESKTLSQMENVLGMPRSTMNRFFSQYAKDINHAEDETLSIANSIWSNSLRPDVTISEGFLNSVTDNYSAEVKSAPFTPETLGDINKWVSDKTGGMIPQVLDDISPEALMYLINALYFEALWEEPYIGAQTDSFTNEDGSKKDTAFLYSDEKTYIDGCGTGFVKYFKPNSDGKSNYAFVALLPSGYDDLEHYIGQLSGRKLSAALRDSVHTDVLTRTPKFKLEYGTELSAVLKSLGMTDAFDEANADFSSLVTPESLSSPYISRVIHKTAIELDEFGTKAGASTVVEVKESAAYYETPPKKVYLQQPFLYMLIDVQTNTPLFIGTVNQL